MRRAGIVAEARRWIGTPYVHQGSCLGGGADCLGLVRGIWRAALGAEPVTVPPYAAEWAEICREERLWHAAARWLRPKPLQQVEAGDVLLFRMREGAVAKHLGIQSETGTEPRFIHAYSGHAVAENTLSAPWARRIAARFAFPFLEE